MGMQCDCVSTVYILYVVKADAPIDNKVVTMVSHLMLNMTLPSNQILLIQPQT